MGNIADERESMDGSTLLWLDAVFRLSRDNE